MSELQEIRALLKEQNKIHETWGSQIQDIHFTINGNSRVDGMAEQLRKHLEAFKIHVDNDEMMFEAFQTDKIQRDAILNLGKWFIGVGGGAFIVSIFIFIYHLVKL